MTEREKELYFQLHYDARMTFGFLKEVQSPFIMEWCKRIKNTCNELDEIREREDPQVGDGRGHGQ